MRGVPEAVTKDDTVMSLNLSMPLRNMAGVAAARWSTMSSAACTMNCTRSVFYKTTAVIRNKCDT